MRNKIIEVKNLNFSYNKNIKVLEKVYFEMMEDDFVGLIGPNGGGKTTFLKILIGILKPDFGEVRVFGKSPKKARNDIGYVPQYAKIELDFPIKVIDVILTGILSRKRMFSRYSKIDKEKSLAAMQKVGIENLKNKQIGELSGGQIQRVLIARALVREPQLLILDEPTSNIDISSEKNLFEYLKEINSSKTAIIVVSHDIGAISPFIKQVGCLNKTMFFHREGTINEGLIKAGYKCDMDLIGHGMPHRVFPEHKH